jgi:hypothetical protein
LRFSDWVRKGWLIPHRGSAREVSDLFAIVARDLADSAVEDLSPDGQLSHAYNAALQSATAALAAAGYRASREQHHYRVIQSLALTIGASPGLVNRLDAFRKKRNFGGYERAGSISPTVATEMRDLARALREDVLTWLRNRHPEMLRR